MNDDDAHARSSFRDGLPEESAEDLYENAPCGYLSTTPDGAIVRVNGTFLAWTGYAREELLAGKRLEDLLTVGARIFYQTHLAPLIHMQGAANEIALDVVCANGRSFPVLMNAALRRAPDGRPVALRAMFVNATDRKTYERELVEARKKAERAAQARADFVSMVSHEIRTPLNAILGVAQLLGMTSPTDQQQRYLRILKSSSESLLALINDVLDFSKIDAGKVTAEERRTDVRDLVLGVANSLGVKADEKSIALRVDVDERLPAWLLCDPLKLRQVVTNLVGNAVKFTSKGGVTLAVRVTEVERDAVTAEFRVEDTGIGIAPERLAHIFEEFSQASYDVGVKYGGTGLGLAISRRLLGLFGSTIHVESTLGAGSVFSFALRMRVPDAQEAPREDESLPEAVRAVRGLRALIVDDNEVNVYVLGGFLRKWGVAFDSADDGQKAVERARSGEYDLVLMDLRMPVLDGYGATRAIRELPDERMKRLPIIAISASIRMGEDRTLEAAGFTDFVGKPIDPDLLLRKISKHAARPGST